MGTRASSPSASCSATAARRGPIHFGAGFPLRQLLVVGGWPLLPALRIPGTCLHSSVHFLSMLFLGPAFWPMTARSSGILLESPRISVRRRFLCVPLEKGWLSWRIVTSLMRRQSLVPRPHSPLHFSRYVYCRLASGAVSDAWTLIHGHEWESCR